MGDNHAKLKRGKVGVLLISLGTPDAPTYGAVRRYLAEFLSDKRVIEVNRLIWLPILYGFILTLRPLRAARAYTKIWDQIHDESPLRGFSRRQAEKLKSLVGDLAEVSWAFRYGNPSISQGLAELQQKGCDRILLFAMYPQYSATSTGTAYDKAFQALAEMRWQPAARTVPAYYDDPNFIAELTVGIRTSLGTLDWQPDLLLASYHSIPESYYLAGDPYPDQCRATSQLIIDALSSEIELRTSFQSRVGVSKWVGPYTDDAVRQLAADGVKKLAVFAPAFSSDCLETLEEIDIELRNIFLEAGGTHFHYIPCLNDSVGGMRLLEHITRSELSNWLETAD